MGENDVGKEDPQLWGSKFDDARTALQAKQWFAFDLDDTLHNFRAASSAALDAVLTHLNIEFEADVDVMRKAYRVILADTTSSAFVDGRTSRDYRKERFELLMKKAQLTPKNGDLERLADTYQDVLSRSLCLKAGALDLLRLLKSMNKKVIIITEGPEDAQMWTIKQLGIYDQIDFVATTNRFGISKVDGMLEKVMETLKISATDLVCIGDNRQRDIEPAVQANVYAIHYAENKDVSLDQTPIRVNTLLQILSMMDDVSNSTA